MDLPDNVKRKAQRKVRAYCKFRSFSKSRKKTFVDYKIYGSDLVIYSIRPDFRRVDGRIESPVALLRFDSKSELWSLRYPDRNGRWHLHPESDVKQSIDQLLAIVEEDSTSHFWG